MRNKEKLYRREDGQKYFMEDVEPPPGRMRKLTEDIGEQNMIFFTYNIRTEKNSEN